MGSQRDIDGAERVALDALYDFSGQRVLEIGAGDLRLTRNYSARAASVLAIDPFVREKIELLLFDDLK
jgi:hypothetical protein